jgi:hypothetical protein
MAKETTEKYAPVGLIVEGEMAVFAKDHRVISNGEEWGLVEDYVKQFGVKEVVSL